MNNLPIRPARALVHDSNQVDHRAETQYQIQRDPGFINFRDVLGALRENLWVILVLATIGAAVAAYVVSKEVQLYSAAAVIRLVDNSSGAATPIVTSSEKSSGKPPQKTTPVASDPIQAEMLVLTGRTVLGRTVDSLGLRLSRQGAGMPASFVDQVDISLPPDEKGTIRLEFGEQGVTYGSADHRRTAAYGDTVALVGARFVVPERPPFESATLVVNPRDTAIDQIHGMLEALPDETTGGIQVTVTSTDPRIAPRIVNGVVETYQAVNAENARKNVTLRREFLEGQLRRTDSLMMLAQGDLSQLRSREQAYTAEGRFTAEQGNLIQLEIEEAQLRGDLRMYENALSRIETARASGQDVNLSMLMSLPGISSDPNVSGLHGQLVSYMNARDTMLTGQWARAATHPEVQRLNTLIAATESRLIDAARGYTTSIRAQIGTVQGLKGRSVAKMSDLPRTEVEQVYLTQNLDALTKTGDQLREQYQSVRLEEAGEAGQVEIVQQATRALPQPRDPWMKILFGLVAGVMLGGGVALVRARLDHSINRPEEIERFLLVPNLAVIPESSAYLIDSSINGGPRNASDPPGVEAYRALRTNLMFSQGNLRTLVLTSATPGEGKTITAVNLAAACARQGKRVLLMECDLRRPALARYFEDVGEVDLTDVFLQGRSWKDAIRPSGVAGLDVLLAGKAFPRAVEFLAGVEMERLLAELSEVYDLVILDTSPLLVAADATILGAIADGVLLVVRATHADRDAVQHALQQLTMVGAHVVGTVLNDPEGAVGRYGNYYDYTYAYEAE